MGGNEDEGAGCSVTVPSDKTRGKKKGMTSEILAEYRNTVFYCTSVKQRNEFPGEVMESLMLDMENAPRYIPEQPVIPDRA